MSWQNLHEVATRELGKEIGDIVLTVADRLRDEGYKIGFVRGQRASLLQLLNKRFGWPLPEKAMARIDAGGKYDFEAWCNRVLTAPTLAEVLGEDRACVIEEVSQHVIGVTTADRLREQGRLQGHREALLKQLSMLFGVLPQEAVLRVNAAGQAELDGWIERMFAARTLAAVLGDP